MPYYGYGYGNHMAKKWWAITQVMIWRVADPSGDYFFTKTLNGTKSTEYDDEIKEIETLVANHNKSPKFNLENKKKSRLYTSAHLMGGPSLSLKASAQCRCRIKKNTLLRPLYWRMSCGKKTFYLKRG